MNQTVPCIVNEIIQNCQLTNSNELSIAGYLASLSPMPVIGYIIFYIITNKPKVLEKKEIAKYIHADGKTRIHEYEIKISWGLEQINWKPLMRIKPVEMIRAFATTEFEFYFIPRDTEEQPLPKGYFKEINKKDVKKAFFINAEKLRSDHIETIYLITKDQEKSDFIKNIDEFFYPLWNQPTKIKVQNRNKIDVRYHVVTLSKQQTNYLLTVNRNIATEIRWNNINVDDSFINQNNCLELTIKEIPKASSELASTVIINLI